MSVLTVHGSSTHSDCNILHALRTKEVDAGHVSESSHLWVGPALLRSRYDFPTLTSLRFTVQAYIQYDSFLKFGEIRRW